MNPDHVRGRLSSDAGATSNSINSPTAPSPIPRLSPTPSLTLSPVSTTSDNSNHRPFAGGLLSIQHKRGRSRLRRSGHEDRGVRPGGERADAIHAGVWL